MSNHYQTLGVAENASPDEIKKAYRKLAMEHHPDRGGDQQKFQDVQAAYGVLGDDQKRHQYDFERQHQNHGGFRFTVNGQHFNMGGMPPGMDDIFGQFGMHFGHDPFAHMRQKRNKDLRVELQIDLSSTLAEQQKTINLQTTTGTRFNVDVTIPRGVVTGTTIKYQNLGDNAFNDVPRGDLFIHINVINNSGFQVQDVHLFRSVDIDCLKAIIGCEQVVHGLDGSEFNVSFPAGTQPGAQVKIPNKGLWTMNSQHRGDLYVVANITVPRNLPPEAFQTITQLVEKL